MQFKNLTINNPKKWPNNWQKSEQILGPKIYPFIFKKKIIIIAFHGENRPFWQLCNKSLLYCRARVRFIENRGVFHVLLSLAKS